MSAPVPFTEDLRDEILTRWLVERRFRELAGMRQDRAEQTVKHRRHHDFQGTPAEQVTLLARKHAKLVPVLNQILDTVGQPTVTRVHQWSRKVSEEFAAVLDHPNPSTRLDVAVVLGSSDGASKPVGLSRATYLLAELAYLRRYEPSGYSVADDPVLGNQPTPATAVQFWRDAVTARNGLHAMERSYAALTDGAVEVLEPRSWRFAGPSVEPSSLRL